MPTPREIADTVTAAFLRGDLETIAGLYAEDAVLEAPEGTLRGREQVIEYWRSFAEGFSDIEVDITRKLDSPDAAMDEWTFTATHTGPLELADGRTVPATGRRVTLRGADVGAVRDGLIVEHTYYYDQMSYLSQLGLVPAAA